MKLLSCLFVVLLLLVPLAQAEEEVESLTPEEMVYKFGPPIKETELEYCAAIGGWISFILELDFALEASGWQEDKAKLRQSAQTAAGLEPLVSSPLGLGQIGTFDIWLRNKHALMSLFTSSNNTIYCLFLGT